MNLAKEFLLSILHKEKCLKPFILVYDFLKSDNIEVGLCVLFCIAVNWLLYFAGRWLN